MVSSCGSSAGRRHRRGRAPPPPDAWPFDHNDDQRAALADAPAYISRINTFDRDPAYDPRFDLNASGGVTLADALMFIPVFNQSCAL